MDSSSSFSKEKEIVKEKEKITQDPIDDDNNDDVMLDIDVIGNDLLFSDDPFPSLPESFPSPSASSISNFPKNPNSLSMSSSSSSSSSSSCSSSPWSFLNHHEEPYMHHQDPMVGPTIAKEATAADIFGDIELWDPSNPPDPSFLFPDDFDTAVQQVPCHVLEGDRGNNVNNNQNLSPNPSSHDQELSQIFLEWLKSNKDSISPEDLRSIKLKTSTIECAAARLGGGKQGKMQLLKLILTWVQNHHLQKKKRRSNNNVTHLDQPPYLHYQFGPTYPNPSPSVDYNCVVEPWNTNNVVNYAQPPSSMNAPPPLPPPPMCAPYGCYTSTSSVMVNSQPFSPSADLHAFSPHLIHPYTLFHGTGLPRVPRYSVGYSLQNPLYPSSSLAGASSATKEARKKRMARQRRSSTLHQHRFKIQNQHLREKASVAIPVSLGSSSSTGNNNNNNNNNSKNWGSWSRQKNLSDDARPSSVTNVQQLRNVGPSEKRQGLKSEKNLKFLLQKVLKQSDVGSLGRIVLPKKEAEIHLPELDTRDGIPILMEDIGTSYVWNMRYRFWPNNKSRMYLLENTGDFVRSNGLLEGDFIVIYSDIMCNKYMIRGVKVKQPAESRGAAKRRQNMLNAHQKNINSSDQAQASSCTSKATTACSSSLFEDNENYMGELPHSDEDGDASPSKTMADDI